MKNINEKELPDQKENIKTEIDYTSHNISFTTLISVIYREDTFICVQQKSGVCLLLTIVLYFL